MKASKSQKQYIYKLCSYQTRLKEEMVQWVTDTNECISCNDLSFEQANTIIKQLGGTPEKVDNWAVFTKGQKSHYQILALCIQIGWRVKNDKFGWVADLTKLNEFLHNESPVKKPLKQMDKEEISKVIIALNGVFKSKWNAKK